MWRIPRYLFAPVRGFKMNRYLQERKGRWYFRIRVPKMLQPHLNTEISYPIWGIDINTANARCMVLGERLKFIFEQAKSGVISMGILNLFVRETCANILYRDSKGMFSQVTPPERYEAAMGHYQTAIQERNAKAAPEFIRLVNNQGVPIDPDNPNDLPIIMNYCQGMIETCRILKERASGNIRNGFDAPDEHGNWSTALSQDDITIPQGEPPWFTDESAGESLEQLVEFAKPTPKEELGNTIRAPETPYGRAMSRVRQLEALTIKRSSDLKRWQRAAVQWNAPQSPAPLQPSAPAQPSAAAPLPYGIRKVKTLKEGIEEYMHEKTSSGKMDRKARNTMSAFLSLLEECFGSERKLHDIDRAMIVKLRSEVLPRYPSNRKKRFPDKSLNELLKMTPAPDPIGAKTQNHYLSGCSTFFNWCVQCGYMANNPARGLVEKAELADLTEQRPPFAPKELKQIFADIADMPEQSNFQSKLYEMRYWIPLIGLYQGMRLNEICQLHLDDVCVVDGLPCLRIQPSKERQQKVKNSSSIRTIPIHSVLLKLGFLDYVVTRWEKKRRKNDQLFEELTRTEDGYLRKMQYFNRRIHERLKISKRKSFHSFRHNFDTELSNKEPNAFLIQCLDGHARQGELGARYSKGNLQAMKETLEKVDYGLDMFKIMGRKPLTTTAVQDHTKRLIELTATAAR